MSRRKSVLLLLAGLLTITGCTEKEDSYRDPLVINIYDTLTDYTGLQEGWYAQVLEDKFNLKLNFLDSSREGSIEEADVFVCSRDEVSPQELTQEELLLNMEPYLEEDPLRNSELFDYKESYEYWNEQLGFQGVYVLPTLVSRLSEMTPSEETLPEHGIYLNWEIYESIGMPDIRNMEELLELLDRMQEEASEERNSLEGLVLYTDNDTDLVDHISSLMSVQGGYREGFLVNVNGRYEDLLDRQSLYLEMLDWLREAYHRGLIPENTDKLSREQAISLYRKGKVLMSIWSRLEADGYALAPVEDMRVVSFGCDPLGSVDTYVGISADTEDPERVLEFVSWLYSTEGIMLSGTDTDLKTAGPQGLTWEVKDGNPVLTDFGKQAFAQILAYEDAEFRDFGENSGDLPVPDEWGGGSWQQGTCKLNLQPVVNVEVSPSGFSYNYTLWNTTIEEYARSGESWQKRMDALDPMEYLIDEGNLVVLPESDLKDTEDKHSQPKEIVDKRAECRKVIVDYSWKIIRSEREDERNALLEEMRIRAQAAGYEDVAEYDRTVTGGRSSRRE